MAIRFERRGRLAVVTIDRPEAMNALDPEHNDAMVEVWREFRDDPDLWVGILTGAGDRAFSAGADLKTMIPALRGGRPADFNFGGLTRGFLSWKPVIAAVNGVALAGGLEMVLACDLRVASRTARFGLAEVRWGIIPGSGGTQRLPRTVSLARAMELILTGEPVDAETALAWGLVNRVVEPEEVMPEALRLAETLLQRGPLALRAAKEAVLRGLDLSLENGLALEDVLFNQIAGTRDAAEGSAAFAEKRQPEFRGE